MVELMEEASKAEASGGDGREGQGSRRLSSFTITVRFPYRGDPLRLILRAAKLRGVPARTYIRERVVACALAELLGQRQVELLSLENREHLENYMLSMTRKLGREGARDQAKRAASKSSGLRP